MKILALDTSTSISTVAVSEDDMCLGELSFYSDLSHSERLIPMIDTLLDMLKLKISDIDVFAVGVGPGSFTGLRIGLETMKAFAHVSGKNLIGVSSLSAMAFGAVRNGYALPIADARRDRVYNAVIKLENGVIVEQFESAVTYVDELVEKYKGLSATVCGVSAKLFAERFENCGGYGFAAEPVCSISAKNIASIAYRRAMNDDYDSCYDLLPDYALLSQAERELKNGAN